MIAGVTLSITATNAGAVPLPCANPDTSHTNTIIGMFVIDGFSSSGTYGEYLTIGEVSELDFRNECKNYTNFRKVFRERIKTVHDYCSGIGEKCEYSGSAGCGIEGSTMYLSCECDIQFTYCTETSTSRALEEKFESQGKGSSSEK